MINKILEEFDKKFFISGKNALGKWIPVLIPAKCEVRDWLEQTLKQNHKVEIEDVLGKILPESRIELLISSAIYFGRINKIKGADREKKAKAVTKEIKKEINKAIDNYLEGK